MKTLYIQSFAGLKKYFGPTLEINAEVSSVGDLLKLLGERYPESSALLKASRVALNDIILSNDYNLNNHETIALLPPSSGG